MNGKVSKKDFAFSRHFGESHDSRREKDLEDNGTIGKCCTTKVGKLSCRAGKGDT